jgi:hypothetical protein
MSDAAFKARVLALAASLRNAAGFKSAYYRALQAKSAKAKLAIKAGAKPVEFPDMPAVEFRAAEQRREE